LRERDALAPQTLEARYLVAESHRHSAKLPLRKLGAVTIETTRNQLNAQIQQELSAAAADYRELQVLLNDKQTAGELLLQEDRILRNSYFSLADVLFDLEKYDEAIQAYATATNRYQSEPEALEAYVQIANCHRHLNRHAEARGTLEQAKVVLDQIRPDAEFTRTTRYNREEWQQLLDWLITL
jgi:tetratricopeptide (TPR) repeat protein